MAVWLEEEVEFLYIDQKRHIYQDFEDHGNCLYVCYDIMSSLNVHVYPIGGFRRFSYNNIYTKCGSFKLHQIQLRVVQ